MRRILSIIATCLFAISMQAGGYFETLTLVNGDILEGYISRQYPGSEIFFTTTKITLFMEREYDAKDNVRYYTKKVDDVSKNLQEWLKNKPQYVQKTDREEQVNLCEFRLESDSILEMESFSDAINLKDNSDSEDRLKFICFPDNKIFRIDMSCVKSIKKHYPNGSEILDVIYTSDSTSYKGVITEQVIGTSFTLLQNKKEKEIMTNDVVKQTKMPVDSTLNIFDVSPFIEEVKCKSNNERVKGVIVSSSYSEGEEDGVVCVYTSRGDTVKIKNSDVLYIYRTQNNRFVSMEPDGVYLQNKELKQSANLKFNNNINVEAENVLNYNLQENDYKVKLVSTSGKEIKDLMLVKADVRKLPKNGYRCTISSEDMLSNVILKYKDEKKASRYERVFEVHDTGYYVLMNRDKKTAYILYIR